MSKVQTALVLEVVSFFMVTVDLYGADRIRSLGERFHRALHQLKTRESTKVRVAAWLLGQIIAVMGVVVPIYREVVPNSALVAAEPQLRILVLIVLNLLSFRLGTHVGKITFWLLANIIQGTATVLQRARLEGLLLLLGAVLFVASKILTW